MLKDICQDCGTKIDHANCVYSTNLGEYNALAIDPPVAKCLCLDCWDSCSPETQKYLNAIVVRNGERE